jgi:hypothetical protein
VETQLRKIETLAITVQKVEENKRFPGRAVVSGIHQRRIEISDEKINQ